MNLSRLTPPPPSPRAALLLACLAFTLPACAPDLAPGGEDTAEDAGDGDGDDDSDGDDLPDDPQMSHEAAGELVITTVDATQDEAWIYMDLETGRQVEEGDPRWDLRFQRFNIAVNGGISGDAGVLAAWLPEVDIEALQAAPDSGWATDEPDGDDEDDDPDLAFADWYDYDVTTHTLTPREGVYVVRTADADYAVQLLDYYNQAGTSGYPTFAWRLVATDGA